VLFLYTLLFRLLILLCIFVSGTVVACSGDETCIEKSSWHIGIAVGVGVKTNPLVDGDNIPLVILPDIAWYSEQAYFDNGELGYQWLSRPKYAFETFFQLDRERAFFSFLHPANILIPIESSATDSPALPTEDLLNNQRSLSINDIASRKWAVNGGIRGHYFLSNSEWQLTFQQDVSNVHKGQQIRLEYSHRWLWRDFRLGLRIGTDWKSTRLIDYYYGVSQRDTDLTELYFNGKSGWQTYLSVNLQKSINENWSWLVNIGHQKLPDSLISSPLIEKNIIQNIFLGVAYRF
jgi:outer membrane protein